MKGFREMGCLTAGPSRICILITGAVQRPTDRLGVIDGSRADVRCSPGGIVFGYSLSAREYLVIDKLEGTKYVLKARQSAFSGNQDVLMAKQSALITKAIGFVSKQYAFAAKQHVLAIKQIGLIAKQYALVTKQIGLVAKQYAFVTKQIGVAVKRYAFVAIQVALRRCKRRSG